MEVFKAIASAALGGFTAGAVIFLGRIKGPLKDRQTIRMFLAVGAGLVVMKGADWLLGLVA